MSITKRPGTLSGLLFVLFASQAVAQTGLTLVTGQLSFSGQYIRQVVSVKNESANLVQSIRVECGFFRQDKLIATAYAFVENVAPGSAGFTDVLARSDAGSDRAQCRVAEAR
jgi:hypothetical protein